MDVETKDWLRWLAVFFLISIGFSLVTGLEGHLALNEPFTELVGFWLAHVLYLVLPGAILGGIVALATKKSKVGLWIMIGINGAILAILLFGTAKQAGF